MIRGDFSSRYLAQLARKLRRGNVKTYQRSLAAALGTPNSAPDALFGLHYSLDSQQIAKAVKQLKDVGAPEIVIFDARYSLRSILSDWRKRLNMVIKHLSSILGRDCPPILLLTDDALIGSRLQRDLFQAQGTKLHVRWSTKLEGVLTPMVGDLLKPSAAAEWRSPPPFSIAMKVTDARSQELSRAFYELASAEGAEAGKDMLTAASRFLRSISALPVPLGVWYDRLNSKGLSDYVCSQWTWAYHEAKLVRWLAEAGPLVPQVKVKGWIAQARAHCASLAANSPLSSAILEAVGKAATGSSRIAIIFKTAARRDIAAQTIESHQGFASGKTYADFSEKVRLITVADLTAMLDSSWAQRYVFVDLDRTALRYLLTNSLLQTGIVILLPAASGKWILRWIDDAFLLEAFKPLKARMSELVRKIEEHFGGNARELRRPSQPVLEFDARDSAHDDNYTGIDPLDAWTIELESGQRLLRAGDYGLYVYDPGSDEASGTSFRRKTAASIEPGDLVFVMNEDLLRQAETVCRREGVDVLTDQNFEGDLRYYHKIISDAFDKHVAGKSIVARARDLRCRILEKNPALSDTFPDSVAYWIRLADSPDTPFEELTSRAPRDKRHFMAFAAELKLQEVVAESLWNTVIMALRNTRRDDGRALSDMYTRLLVDPGSVTTYNKLSEKSGLSLRAAARDALLRIVAIRPPSRHAASQKRGRDGVARISK